MKSKHFVGLDLVRFFAACLVMFFHLGFQTRTQSPALIPYTWFGWIGVQIFFVLSGVVIARSAENASAARFLRGRILRLYPAVWICATISLVIAGGRMRQYVGSLVLWPFAPWINGVYWTLGVEMVFYAIIFLLLARHRLRWLERVFCGMAVLGATYGVLSLAGLKIVALHNVIQPVADSRLAELLLIPHGALFALGGTVWLCRAKGITAFRLGVIGLSLIAGVAQIYVLAAGRWSVLGQSPAIPALVWLMCVGLIVVSLRVEAAHSRWIRRLGLMTYPLYLLHDDIGRAVLKGGGGLVLAILASVAAALVVTIILEPQVRKGLALLLNQVGLALSSACAFIQRPSPSPEG